MTESTATPPAVNVPTLSRGQSIARLDQYGVDSPYRPYLENMAAMIDDLVTRKQLVNSKVHRQRMEFAITKLSVAIDWYLASMKTEFE